MGLICGLKLVRGVYLTIMNFYMAAFIYFSYF